MPGVFLYAPSHVPKPPVPNPWHGLSMTLTAYDGSTWSITDYGTSGLFVTNGGIRGLTMPPITRYSSTSPAVPGSRYRGWKADEREVFLPLLVYSDTSSAEWLEHNAKFGAVLRPDQLTTWTVTRPDAVTRTLAFRYSDDGDASLTRDPITCGYTVVGLKGIAEQPFWSGAPITRTWGNLDATDWQSSPGDDWVIRISQGPTVETATITNPGDVDVYPVWTLIGPISSASVGVYDAAGVARQIQVTHPIADGESLVIDPSPTVQTATHSATGENWVTKPGYIGGADFAGSAIPPGQNVKLATLMAGEGAISATLVPRYFRAF